MKRIGIALLASLLVTGQVAAASLAITDVEKPDLRSRGWKVDKQDLIQMVKEEAHNSSGNRARWFFDDARFELSESTGGSEREYACQ